jgi:RAB protein geranylgeranyltransferase component A
VSSYATFRLLEHTAVFKPSSYGSEPSLSKVPASKEDIFKTKLLSLIDKRKLMKLLMHLASDSWDIELQDDPVQATRPFIDYLAGVHKLPPDLVDAVAYGVALCSTPRETTREAMLRVRLHMKSIGKYGNSAYLVGQYGGAGELAQGYCRASAVKGATFILDHQIDSAARKDARWNLTVAGLEQQVTADYLVSSDEILETLGLNVGQVEVNLTEASAQSLGCMYRCILILDKPVYFCTNAADATNYEETSDAKSESTPAYPPETGLLIFPPGAIGKNKNSIMVLMMGEGTFSCPKGQCKWRAPLRLVIVYTIC